MELTRIEKDYLNCLEYSKDLENQLKEKNEEIERLSEFEHKFITADEYCEELVKENQKLGKHIAYLESGTNRF